MGRRTLVALVLALASVLGFLVSVWVRAWRTRAAREDLAALIQADLDARSEARFREPAPEPIPDERNAAVLYWKAIEEMNPGWMGRVNQTFDQEWTTPPEALLQALEENAGVLDRVARAATLQECRFTKAQLAARWGGGKNVPGYGIAFQLLLRGRIRLALHEGRFEDAVTDAVTLQRMGRHLGPVHPMAYQHHLQARPGLLLLTADPRLEASSARRLLAALATGREVAASMPVPWGETSGLAGVPDGIDRTARHLLSENGGQVLSQWTGEPRIDRAGPRDLLSGKVILGPPLAEEVAWWREVQHRFHALVTARPEERVAALAALRREVDADLAVKRPGHEFVGVTLAGLVNHHEIFWKEALAQEALRAVLAIRIHRLEGGGLPPSLEELVPGVLPEVPRDPFGGGPLLLKRIEGGVIVYAPGLDGVDDGADPIKDWIGHKWIDPAPAEGEESPR